jgi:mercuric ion transport protein
MNNLFPRIADKTGMIGSIVGAMSCGACFPALASLGSALGLGFLSQYEGLFITTLIPLFAGIALVANALGWLRHRSWLRSVLGMVGPLIVLASTRLFMGRSWNEDLLYVGMAFMIGVSLWDIFGRKRSRACATDACELAPKA